MGASATSQPEQDRREALLRAALAGWEEEATEGVIRGSRSWPTRGTGSPASSGGSAGDDDDPALRPAEPVRTLAFTLAVADAAGDPVVEECFGALGVGPEEAPGRMPSGEEGRAYRRHLVATLLPQQDSGDPPSSRPPALGTPRRDGRAPEAM